MKLRQPADPKAWVKEDHRPWLVGEPQSVGPGWAAQMCAVSVGVTITSLARRQGRP